MCSCCPVRFTWCLSRGGVCAASGFHSRLDRWWRWARCCYILCVSTGSASLPHMRRSRIENRRLTLRTPLIVLLTVVSSLVRIPVFWAEVAIRIRFWVRTRRLQLSTWEVTASRRGHHFSEIDRTLIRVHKPKYQRLSFSGYCQYFAVSLYLWHFLSFLEYIDPCFFHLIIRLKIMLQSQYPQRVYLILLVISNRHHHYQIKRTYCSL